MVLHELRFSSKGALTRALGRLLSCSRVEDCVVDETTLTVHFSAPAEELSRLLFSVERGGDLLRWSFYEIATAT